MAEPSRRASRTRGEGIAYLDVRRHRAPLSPARPPELDLGRSLIAAADAAALPARVGIASSKLAARIAAGLPDPPVIVPAGEEAAFLAPLPLARLAPDADMAGTLERWGVRTVGDFAKLWSGVRPPYVNWYGAYFAEPGAIEAIDMVAIHAYTHGGLSATYPDTGPAGLPSLGQNCIDGCRAQPVTCRSGARKAWGDTLRDLPDSDLQAGFVARYYLVGWSVGFRRLYWYAADNSWGRLIHQNGEGGCDDHGKSTGCLTAAGHAWVEVEKWMVGNRMTVPCAADVNGKIWTCTLIKPDGISLLAVWDTSQTCSHGSCSTSDFVYPHSSTFITHWTTLSSTLLEILRYP